MKMYTRLLLSSFLLWSQNCLAEQGDVNLAMKGGTLGLGAEIGVNLSDDVVVRGGVNSLLFNFDSTVSQVDYNMEPNFKNGSLLLDWHPFSGAFRLTGGLFVNKNEINLDGTYRKDLIPVEYQQYEGLTDIAHVKGTVDFNSVAPYAGLGWSSNHGQKGWGLAFDMGIMFQGEAQVSELYIEAPFGLEAHPEAIHFLHDQKQALEDDLKPYQYYPVASLTLSYTF